MIASARNLAQRLETFGFDYRDIKGQDINMVIYIIINIS